MSKRLPIVMKNPMTNASIMLLPLHDPLNHARNNREPNPAQDEIHQCPEHDPGSIL